MLLDATAIPADRGGVGRYLDGLIPELSALPDVDLIVVCQQRDAELYRTWCARVVEAPEQIAERGPRLLWEQVALPRVARRVGAQVLHCPHYTMPLRAGVPTVVTLHDATFFSDPQVHTQVKRWFFRAATHIAVRRAAELVVPSAATRDELVRLVSARAARAQVALHGVDTATFHPPTVDEIVKLRAELGLTDQAFVAFLGTIEPRKNVGNLIRGWITACADRSGAPALVLAGGRGWDDTIDAIAAEVPPQLRLVRPGYLPLDALRALLGGAELVAYPAIGEGFGLPVLEAMACGAAVLTTNRLAIPEVGGDAVSYTDVDVHSISTKLTELLDSPAVRRALGERARQRAASFTWARAAKVHADVYANAARQG